MNIFKFFVLHLIYNEVRGRSKATLTKFFSAAKFCEIFLLFLTKVHTVKSKGKISQNFVAFSEYMNFTTYLLLST